MIERELQALTVNPTLGSPHYGGPFESRRIHRFSISLSGVTCYLQVVYKLHQKDGILVVAGFQPVSF
jgi:hypothetical protein